MTPQEPEVSVVVTTRDRAAELVRRAVESALAQTFQDLEIIVVDDGSSSPFQMGETDRMVSVIRLPRSRGVSGARNAGLARARGRWVTFLDDDDELMPEMLEVSLQAASHSTLSAPVAVVSGVEIRAPDGSVQTVRLPPSLPKGRDYFLEGAPPGRRLTVGNTLVIPREILTRIGGFDEALRSAVHSELLLRVNAACSIEGVPVVTYRINRHHGDHVHRNLAAKARAMELTERKHAERFARHPRAHARYLSATGVWYVKAGRWWPAIRSATRALRVAPLERGVIRAWLVSLGGPPLLALYRRLVRARGPLRRHSGRSTVSAGGADGISERPP